MGAIASQITSLTIVYPTVYSDADERKHQRSASLAFVRGIHRGSVNSPHKWPVTRKMFPFDDVIWNIQSERGIRSLSYIEHHSGHPHWLRFFTLKFKLIAPPGVEGIETLSSALCNNFLMTEESPVFFTIIYIFGGCHGNSKVCSI